MIVLHPAINVPQLMVAPEHEYFVRVFDLKKASMAGKNVVSLAVLNIHFCESSAMRDVGTAGESITSRDRAFFL